MSDHHLSRKFLAFSGFNAGHVSVTQAVTITVA